MNQINKHCISPPPSGVVKNNGFTIIEVALVLAIAGLIFLVVFLALPALQNSQKDTARKQDVGRVVTAIENYYADGGNALTSANNSGATSYIGVDSSALSHYIKYSDFAETSFVAIFPYPDSTTNLGGNPGTGHIDIHVGKQCPSSANSTSVSAPLPDATSSNDAAVVVKLSSGGRYCAEATD